VLLHVGFEKRFGLDERSVVLLRVPEWWFRHRKNSVLLNGSHSRPLRVVPDIEGVHV